MGNLAGNFTTTARIEHGPRGPHIVSAANPFVARMHEVEGTQPGDALMLATRALRHDPGCIEALVFLSHRTKTFDLRLEHLQTAVDAGDHLWRTTADELGEAMAWWDIPATRPYMLAIQELGDAHAEIGNTVAARWCYERLLRMNPNDDQGIAASFDELDATAAPRMR